MAASTKPDGKFLLGHPAHWIALGLGSGLPRLAPGTWGTLAGWLLYVWLDRWLTGTGWAILLTATFVLGAWAAQRTGAALAAADSSHIVIDEILAFWIVLLMLPAHPANPLWQQAAAFLIFRFFDIVKPPPIRAVDARFKNGLGVMADDLIAAFYTLLVVALWTRLA